ncbi:MAG: hypothetical protein ACXVAX_11195 [Pseudobdellovibrio sp.]
MITDKFKFFLVCTTFGGTMLYRAFRHKLEKRPLVAPTAKPVTSSAKPGLIELEGFAWSGPKPRSAPSPREGIYYRFELQKAVRMGRHKEWQTVFTSTNGDSFYLVDAKGAVLINTNGAELNFESDEPVNWNSLDKHKKSYLLKNIIDESIPDFPPSFGPFGSAFRIIEHELVLGSPVYVRGSFRTESGKADEFASPGLVKFLDQIYQKSSTKLKNMNVLMGVNRPGKIYESEATYNYTMLAQISKRNAAAENKNGDDEDYVPIYGEVNYLPEHGLFIANAHEEYLMQRLQKFLYGQFVGGVACTAFAFLSLFTSNARFESISTSLKNLRALAVPPQSETVNRDIADDEPRSLTELHDSCARSKMEACESLVNHEKQFRLEAKYVAYYKKKACELGSKKISCR